MLGKVVDFKVRILVEFPDGIHQLVHETRVLLFLLGNSCPAYGHLHTGHLLILFHKPAVLLAEGLCPFEQQLLLLGKGKSLFLKFFFEGGTVTQQISGAGADDDGHRKHSQRKHQQGKPPGLPEARYNAYFHRILPYHITGLVLSPQLKQVLASGNLSVTYGPDALIYLAPLPVPGFYAAAVAGASGPVHIEIGEGETEGAVFFVYPDTPGINLLVIAVTGQAVDYGNL